MWEFRVGNTFGAVVFSSYGGFWISLASLNVKCFGFLDGYTGVEGTRDLHDCLGIYLLSWAMFTLFNTLAFHRTNLAFVVVLFLVFLVFLMLSIAEFTGSILCQEAGGCFGVMAAFLAWYIAYASMLTKKNSFVILPLGDLDPMYRSWGIKLPDDDESK